MWRDISDDIQIKVGHILHDEKIIGFLKDGLIGVFKEGFRVRLEREYDDEGYVNRFFVEKNTAGQDVVELLKIMAKPVNIIPFLEVPNMQFLEMKIKNFEIFFNMEMIESFEKKSGNLSIIKMQSGAIYEVDYNVQRISKKIGEASSKPAT